MFMDRSSDCRWSVTAAGYLLRCLESWSATLNCTLSTPSLEVCSYWFSFPKSVLAVWGSSACLCLLSMFKRASTALCLTWNIHAHSESSSLSLGVRSCLLSELDRAGSGNIPRISSSKCWLWLWLSLAAMLAISTELLVSLLAAFFCALDSLAQILLYCLLCSLDVIKLLYWCLCQ